MVSILDIQKGETVILAGTGWKADVKGSTRGFTTLCYVEGPYPELGSVYTTDIIYVERDGILEDVYHTPGQLKQAAKRKAAGW